MEKLDKHNAHCVLQVQSVDGPGGGDQCGRLETRKIIITTYKISKQKVFYYEFLYTRNNFTMCNK